MDSSNESKKELQASKAFGLMSYMIAIQFASRIAHFLLNLVIVRFMTPENYGRASLQLPVITTIVTRIVKEALHRVAVREKKHEDNNETNRAENLVLVWISIPIAIVFSIIVCFVYLQVSLDVKMNPWMIWGLGCWLLSSWIELLIEPILIYLESHLKMNISLNIEILSLAVHSSLTIVLLFSLESVNLLQAYGQLIYSLCLLFGYYFYAFYYDKEAKKDIWPSSFTLRGGTLNTIKPFIWQSLGKYVTAEGENWILLTFGDATQQGIFGFVQNLGSLVARIAFLSIERAGFLLFTRMKDDKKERIKVWKLLLNISFMISFLYLSTCPPYINLLVKLVYDKWSNTDAPNLLAFYGVYLLLIGVNGLIEAHRDALSPYSLIQKSTGYTFFFVIFYFVLGAPFMYYFGAGGMIAASCINTFIRTVFNLQFFGEFLLPIQEGIPTGDLLTSFGLLAIIGMTARYILGDTTKLLIVGIIEGLVYVIWLFLFKRKELVQTWQVVKQKRS